MMGPFLEVIAVALPELILIILLPVAWVAAAPVILVRALMQPGPYGGSVRRMYRTLTRTWLDWTIRAF
jgi:hypothetical protein